jgi:hypothetical protein
MGEVGRGEDRKGRKKKKERRKRGVRKSVAN